jgi:hypothetical protein
VRAEWGTNVDVRDAAAFWSGRVERARITGNSGSGGLTGDLDHSVVVAAQFRSTCVGFATALGEPEGRTVRRA